jgi:hypothetical protein
MIKNATVRMFDSLQFNSIETFNSKFHCKYLFSSEKKGHNMELSDIASANIFKNVNI